MQYKTNFSSWSSSNFYKVFSPVLTSMVRRQVAKEIENNVIRLFDKGDQKLTEHLGGRNNINERKETRRTSFISQIFQTVNRKIIGMQ